ncbi:MAG: hypothetical protein ACYC8T_20255 [Myxococcaceae bacterium]
MSARRCLCCLLALLALALPSEGFAQDKKGEGPAAPADPSPGQTARAPPPPSQEDLEVMQNLELLENLDESSDLELMQELTVEQ